VGCAHLGQSVELPETSAVETRSTTIAQGNVETERITPYKIVTHDPQQSPVTSHSDSKPRTGKHRNHQGSQMCEVLCSTVRQYSQHFTSGVSSMQQMEQLLPPPPGRSGPHV